MHAKASMHCKAVNLRLTETALEPRQNQMAGSAKSSHARFSSSSIKNKDADFEVEIRISDLLVFQKPQN
jgi:hypothetical protein